MVYSQSGFRYVDAINSRDIVICLIEYLRMLTIAIPDSVPADLQNTLKYAIAPRPICLASTIDGDGNVNLSPFSFFNIFSTNKPLCIFSPVRRERDRSTKHSLENVLQVPECVINIVNYDIVHQQSLASVEYGKGVDEFKKSGLTPLASRLVKPPRVAESPVQLECVVNEVITFSDQGGSANLIVAEIKLMHINEAILDENGQIDQAKIDLVARLGGDWYCRVTADNLFKVPKPNRHIGIGVDAIPYSIRNSTILTGNNLGQLGNISVLPTDDVVEAYAQNPEVKEILDATIGDERTRDIQLHLKAKELLDQHRVDEAWMVLLAGL